MPLGSTAPQQTGRARRRGLAPPGARARRVQWRTRRSTAAVHAFGACWCSYLMAANVLVSQSVTVVGDVGADVAIRQRAVLRHLAGVAGASRWFTPRTTTSSTDLLLLSLRARSARRSACGSGTCLSSAAVHEQHRLPDALDRPAPGRRPARSGTRACRPACAAPGAHLPSPCRVTTAV